MTDNNQELLPNTRILYAIQNPRTGELYGYDVSASIDSCECCGTNTEITRDYTTVTPEIPVALFNTEKELQDEIDSKSFNFKSYNIVMVAMKFDFMYCNP